jgi:hypothetical protein
MPAARTASFTESVIREMTRVAQQHGAINLAQGFPNFPAPDLLKEAAARAIHDNINQYAITWGARRLREAVARKYHAWYGMAVDPDAEVTVTCGATEAMIARLMALIDPGDEVIVFEPFYENYGPDCHPLPTPRRCSCRSCPGRHSTSTAWPGRSARAPGQSSSTHRPTRAAGCSPARSSRGSRCCASDTTPGPSPTRSTSISATARLTSRSPRSRACASGR